MVSTMDVSIAYRPIRTFEHDHYKMEYTFYNSLYWISITLLGQNSALEATQRETDVILASTC